MKQDETLIFSHYGKSPYLDYTLGCATRTNPKARRILLGDFSNRKLAIRNGWEHYDFSDFRSAYHDEFDRVFKPVYGKGNPGNVRWLKYVFERWFHIDGFIHAQGIDRFWHFDSDTMIVRDLSEYKEALASYEFTTQCNGTCLNGVVSAPVVEEFCASVCAVFKDDAYLAEQKKSYDALNPDYAFTEMAAFELYHKKSPRQGVHALYAFDGVAFDDALMQEQGFTTSRLPDGRAIKQVCVRDGSFYGERDGQEVVFPTLNLSWVDIYVFQWVWNALGKPSDEIANAKPLNVLQRMALQWHKSRLLGLRRPAAN